MKGQKIDKICASCNKEFVDYISNKRSNFCSLPCYWKSKKGMIGYWFGKNRSIETIEKIRLAKIGKPSLLKGIKRKPHTEETKVKLSIANKGKHPKTPNFKEGKTHHNWKGGVSDNRHKVRTIKYRKWVSDVFKRDNFACQNCKVRGCYLQAHHIKSWAQYPNLRFNVTNGLTLCVPCHKLTDNFAGKNNAYN